jgi:hypothetical protein
MDKVAPSVCFRVEEVKMVSTRRSGSAETSLKVYFDRNTSMQGRNHDNVQRQGTNSGEQNLEEH